MGVFSSLPFPSVLLPSFSFSLPSSFHPFPRPLNQLWGLMECSKLPQRGPGGFGALWSCQKATGNNNNNNNNSFILTAGNPQLIFYNKLPRRTAHADTTEHKEPAIIQPNMTTRISVGGRQLCPTTLPTWLYPTPPQSMVAIILSILKCMFYSRSIKI